MIAESTVRALVVLSVATTSLMMRLINSNGDLGLQITQVVSRLHVGIVVIVSLNLQRRLQSRVCRIGETNRTIKFSGSTTSVCRGYIGDDEIRQLLKGTLNCGARRGRGGNFSGTSNGLGEIGTCTSRRDRSGDPLSSIGILVCQRKEFSSVTTRSKCKLLHGVMRNSGIGGSIGIVDTTSCDRIVTFGAHSLRAVNTRVSCIADTLTRFFLVPILVVEIHVGVYCRIDLVVVQATAVSRAVVRASRSSASSSLISREALTLTTVTIADSSA